ncbi:XRE family transcriptional regulator [Streptomyces pseudogriseolus]|uniref:XRE family transcriptional regulator n=1 Tax=Streptomyces pseudogriseolus TaxID=36817 RepID=UPI00349B6C89
MRKYLTPDQIRLREDLAGARDRIVVLLNLAVGESLSTEQAQEFVEKARAWSGPNAFRLLRYLASRPDALSAPTPDCPPCGVRLIALLIEAGHGAKVGLVPCADCGRTNPLPRYAGPEGRLCHGCSSRRLAVPCARCGKLSKAVARRPDGRICQVCKEKEPGSRKECVSCRRMMIPTRHLPDGTYLCQTCAPKKLQTCCRCGRRRRANALTADGPVCGTCYASPARRCGICEQVGPIRARAKGEAPDICYRCYVRPEKLCTVCGRIRRGHHIEHGNGPFHCDGCVPREARKRQLHVCALCGQERKVGVFWPVGPVCPLCYRTALTQPESCTRCGRQRILVGRTPAGGRICKACSFPDERPDYCSSCQQPADLLPGRHCPRCTLLAKVTSLLSRNGTTLDASLRPLADVLSDAPNPYPVLAWLRRSPAARLLGQLVTAPDELDHAALDALPQGHATTYVRSLLTTAGLLPPRDENLALLINWTARTLAKLPGHQATLIRPFAEWHIIRDARRRSARGRYTYTAHKGDCGNIRAAIDFLTWLDTQQCTLQSLTQEDLDMWAISRPTLRARSIPFIRWAGARHLTRAGLTIEHRPSQLPGQFQIEEDHYEELRRCLNDPTLPSDVRIAAALIRLYALPLTRIVELTTDHLRHDADHTYLTIIRHPVVLPPKLARLIDDHLEEGFRHSNEATRYLLPGRVPGRPRNPAGLSDKLQRYGLPARAARNTAMMQALADLPPGVLADLIGIQPRTAERFAAMAGENWSDYLAAAHPRPRPTIH